MSDFSIVKIDEANLGFLKRLVGPVAEAGDLLSDKIRFYRWRSAISTLEKARKYAIKKKINPAEVPIKFLVPFLEGCSLEEDDSDLVDYWAKILAGAMQDPKLAKNVFIETLRNSSTTEIKILDELVDKKFIKLLRSAPGLGEIQPSMIVNALTTMRRIQLADHIEKSVLYVIEYYEEDLTAEAESVEEFLMALAMHDHTPVRVENIIISDRAGSSSYGDEVGYGRNSNIKKRWKKTLENKTLFGANVDLVQNRAELDALTAKGLVDRTHHTFDAYDGHGFFSLVSPTPLGVEFVCACRGEALPYPKEEAGSESDQAAPKRSKGKKSSQRTR